MTAAPSLRLTVTGGPLAGREVDVGGEEAVVGRDPSSDVVIASPHVSGRHAHIRHSEQGWEVTDLDSTNGTYLNGVRVAHAALRRGDLLLLGAVELLVDTGGAGRPGPVLPETPVDVTPTETPRTVLVSHAGPDRGDAERIVQYLQRAGHQVWIDRAEHGDGWGGRLLDTVWSCDVAVFVVSPASGRSGRIHREVHLAGSERTPVIPVVLAPAELPAELAWYLSQRPPIDLSGDFRSGLERLGAAIDAVPRKRIARPWRLVGLVLLGIAALIALYVLYQMLLGS
ncbi:MAG: TIR domain-containing protein [Actinomycetota bacterium]|nr:TIR domain-containing protein [Actinomycetota bacterium]